MSQALKTKIFKQAIRQLDGIGARYQIIFDGETYGEALEKAEKKPKRRGVVRQYIKPLIADMKPGETRNIPAGKHSRDHVAFDLCRLCYQNWGRGSYATRSLKKSVEVMRLY